MHVPARARSALHKQGKGRGNAMAKAGQGGSEQQCAAPGLPQWHASTMRMAPCMAPVPQPHTRVLHAGSSGCTTGSMCVCVGGGRHTLDAVRCRMTTCALRGSGYTPEPLPVPAALDRLGQQDAVVARGLLVVVRGQVLSTWHWVGQPTDGSGHWPRAGQCGCMVWGRSRRWTAASLLPPSPLVWRRWTCCTANALPVQGL